MVSTPVTTLRLPESLIERAEALVPFLAGNDVGAAAGQVTRSAVVRYALALGLSELERKAEYEKRQAQTSAASSRQRR